MKPRTEPYLEQCEHWPLEGRHILASFDDASVFVYQAYRPEIGEYAAKHGRFGPPFSFSRMSWIKPNFLWMMYRSGWGTKEGQGVTLALRLRREFFESLLLRAVASTHDRRQFSDRDQWRKALAASEVRLQWDPDHDPAGARVERRAIQLGLRGPALRGWDGSDLLQVIDLSEFVAEQREHVERGDLGSLRTPAERVYPVSDGDIRRRLALD